MPATATAGSPVAVAVTALDPFNNTATKYTGTIHFTTSDSTSGSAVPSDYTFVAADNGVHTFANGVTLVTAGSQTVTATDTADGKIAGTSSAVTVGAAAATHFGVTAFAEGVTAGSAFSVLVTALDPFNNTDPNYAGTVRFTSTDSAATLPADSALSQGGGEFSVTLRTAGNQTVTAADSADRSIAGTSDPVPVYPAAADHLMVGLPSAATAGGAFTVTVTAQDPFGNTAPSYAGTVHFSSSDGGSGSMLPPDYTFPEGEETGNGSHTFTNGVTLVTAGSQRITATDTVAASITGSNTVPVTSAGPDRLTLSAPRNVAEGEPFTITATVLDAYGNPVTDYVGTVHFDSPDGRSRVPADYTFVAADQGRHAFDGVRLGSPGAQVIRGADIQATALAAQTTPVLVANVAPHDLALGISAAEFNGVKTILLDGQFRDPGTSDTFTVSIDWGDGSLPQTVQGLPVASLDARLANPPGTHGFQVVHVYTGAGVFTITATVTDADQATDPFTGTGTIAIRDLSDPNTIASATAQAQPGDDETAFAPGITARLHRDKGSPGRGGLRVETYRDDPQPGSLPPGLRTLVSYDVLQLGLGGDDFAVVTFQYPTTISPSLRPSFLFYDPKTGKYQLIDLSAVPGQGNVDTDNRIVSFRFDKRSTFSILSLTGTVFTIAVPDGATQTTSTASAAANTARSSAAPTTIDMTQATSAAPQFISDTELTVALTGSQDRSPIGASTAAGGDKPLGPLPAVEKAFLWWLLGDEALWHWLQAGEKLNQTSPPPGTQATTEEDQSTSLEEADDFFREQLPIEGLPVLGPESEAGLPADGQAVSAKSDGELRNHWALAVALVGLGYRGFRDSGEDRSRRKPHRSAGR